MFCVIGENWKFKIWIVGEVIYVWRNEYSEET